MAIAVDAMGGDHAPEAIVTGAVSAAAERKIPVILVGDEERLSSLLEEEKSASPLVSVRHASEVVGMADSPSTAVRRIKDSSIRVAFDLLKRGEADAVVSAGNSGATMAVAMFVLKKIEGVDRPAIVTFHPTAKGFSLLLDAGGNVDCKPFHLVQFAIMGSVFASRVLKKENPRVGVLSNGSEEGKGNELTREAHMILKRCGLNYIGLVEGRDIYNGSADVVVCDGFVGNVGLKMSEGLAEVLERIFREEIRKSLRAKLGYLLIKPVFKEVAKKGDYSEYGGAPLLGINGTCVICHGNSTPKAIANAVGLANNLVESQFNRFLMEGLAKNQELLRLGQRQVMRFIDQLKGKIIR
ncbi:MAG: phosphate acyltransferase PlsX [Deltaproteobacteria bacterium]|nr:phosphate acyltransferase PlsX [Deltaproteobacteria bacterium]